MDEEKLMILVIELMESGFGIETETSCKIFIVVGQILMS